ncbi:MAG: hypothetical protein LBI77_01830 [Puniceicoccales bacterium]|jgi:uncharacterized protein YcfJ|nr:hypothetical protein [Puniceicoccales bacterium]
MKAYFMKYGLLLPLLLCAGCDSMESSLGGAALGTAAGAGTGYALGGKGGAIIGGILGGMGGGAIGHSAGRSNEQKEAYAAENARLRAQANGNYGHERGQGSRRDDEVRELQRSVELKRLKNEQLEQELERKRLKKERREFERER